MEKIIDINLENIDDEHISCAISDKKCSEGYKLKKEWFISIDVSMCMDSKFDKVLGKN